MDVTVMSLAAEGLGNLIVFVLALYMTVNHAINHNVTVKDDVLSNTRLWGQGITLTRLHLALRYINIELIVPYNIDLEPRIPRT